MNWIRDGPRLSNKEADMDEKNFVMRAEFEEYKERIDSEDKRQNRRIELLEENFKQLTSISLSVQSLAQSMEGMSKKQDDFSKRQDSFSERLENIEKEPAKNWNTLKTAVITAIAGGVAGWLLGVLATFAQ